MLILHAADLHLGKTLHERDLSLDQEAMLERLLELLAEHRPAALLLAGDLYDRSIPPPDAVRLFDSFLSRAMTGDPSLVVVAIPGNHDSAARLSFGTHIMSRTGLHIRTDPELCTVPVLVERDGERAAIWPLPFLGAGAFVPPPSGGQLSAADAAETAAGVPESADAGAAAGTDGQAELDFESAADTDRAASTGVSSSGAFRGQAELFAEAISRIRPLLDVRGSEDRATLNILLAHCFAAGGSPSESERAFVGSAEQVDASVFARFDYAALGHLHSFQRAGETGRYAGSPLAYSFAEGTQAKGFVLVELKAGAKPLARLLPIVPLHSMRRLEGPFSVLSAPGAFAEFRDDFIEARLTDSQPVLNPADPLRSNFPNLLSVRQAAFELQSSVPQGSASGGSRALADIPRSVFEDFADFYAEMKSSPPDEATAEVFASLVKEAERETF